MAIRRSHHSASSSPPARHQPEIAAIVGFEAREAGEAERAVWPLVEPGVDRRLRVVAAEVGGALGERLQVGAGAERLRTLAGEHQGAGVVVGLEVVKALGEQPPRSRRRPRCAAPAG